MATEPLSAPDLPQDPVECARVLLGAELAVVRGGARVVVRLTEVEAYAGETDPASHAYRGPNRRNASMFAGPGTVYVYRHMGLHHCVNLVCGPVGVARAVLLRSGEVIQGADVARARRRAQGVCRSDRDLARGPGRLTVAAGLTLADDGTRLGEAGLSLVLASEPAVARRGPRVGVGAAGADPQRFGWRFWIAGDPHVSGPARMGT